MCARKAGEKPNVIVFFTDQQRWDSTGVHGNPMNITPNFDRMAREGTLMHNAFTCQPVCLPARASLQTGKFATQVGCHTNAQNFPADEKSLAHYFGEAGYHTGYIGKLHLYGCGNEPVPEEKRIGYQHWLAANVLEFCSDAYNCVMYDNANNEVKLPGYRVDGQ
ncbi:MAG: sulfatase-like hydrolase/transferase, partial [Planctomycetota bacterium]